MRSGRGPWPVTLTMVASAARPRWVASAAWPRWWPRRRGHPVWPRRRGRAGRRRWRSRTRVDRWRCSVDETPGSCSTERPSPRRRTCTPCCLHTHTQSHFLFQRLSVQIQPIQCRLIAKFHYTGPTRARHGHGHGLFCGETPLGPCGSVRVRVRVRVVEFSYYYTTVL